MARAYFDTKILDVFDGRLDPDDIGIDYRLYGSGAVLGVHEPAALDPAELGVLITVTAPDQRTAHPVSTFVAHASAHVKVSLPRPTVQGSPRDSDRYAGQQYAPLMAMELPEPDRPV